MASNPNVGDSAATQTYYFSDLFAIDRNTALFVSPPDTEGLDYDYIISLDVNTLSTLFTNKSYKQNESDINEVDITLTLDQNEFNSAFNYTSMISPTAGNGTRSLIGGKEVVTGVDTRVLEILALKIFGHAKARAAIANDTQIINLLQSEMFNHFNGVVQNHKHDIFNQYVNYDLSALNTNDVTGYGEFDLTNDIISFPACLRGHLYNNAGDATTGGASISAFLNNGPTTGANNDTVLVDGAYNVPILFKIGKYA